MLHGVTLITSVTFVTHVISVTSVTCSIRKFHQSKYISTPLLNFLIYSGTLTNISSLKESRRILPKKLAHISYLSIVGNPNQGMLIALNSFPYIMISPHHMSCSLGIPKASTHVNCTPVVNEDLDWLLALFVFYKRYLLILQELFQMCCCHAT